MIAPLNFELNGQNYQALPHTGFIALDLQRKVSAFYTSVFRNAEKLEDNALFEDMTERLGNLPADEYRWLVENTLSNVTVTTPGEKNHTLANIDAVADHFAGRAFTDLYQLIFKIWELEKFGPFGLTDPAGK